MDSRQKIYRLLRLALLEIRHLSSNGDQARSIYALSDLMHNIPSALCQQEPDFDKIWQGIIARASGNSGLLRWVEANANEESA